MKTNALSLLLLTLSAFSLVAGLTSCNIEQERQVVLPESQESELPWNGMQDGEGLGQLGAFQRR